MFLYLAMIDSDADKSKFEILYSEYKNLMYYTANHILRNSNDAEDVVHQAFSKSSKFWIPFLHQGVTKRVRCSSLLPSTKQSTCTAKAALPLAEEYIGAAPAAEIERLAARDTGRRYRVLAAALPLGTATAVRLRLFNAEIANILDTTEPNVRKLIQRAKEKLSAALSGMEEP